VIREVLPVKGPDRVRQVDRGSGCRWNGGMTLLHIAAPDGVPPAHGYSQVVSGRGRLAAAGARFADVVKLTFFVLDMAHLPALRRARDEVVVTAAPPASTAVQVAGLFAPGYLFEVEALALVEE
jgi:Endoribonuclease L-PSP